MGHSKNSLSKMKLPLVRDSDACGRGLASFGDSLVPWLRPLSGLVGFVWSNGRGRIRTPRRPRWLRFGIDLSGRRRDSLGSFGQNAEFVLRRPAHLGGFLSGDSLSPNRRIAWLRFGNPVLTGDMIGISVWGTRIVKERRLHKRPLSSSKNGPVSSSQSFKISALF